MSTTSRRTRLTLVRPGLPLPPPRDGETVAGFDDFLAWVKTGKAIGMLARFDESRMLVHRLESAGRPLPLALALRWMTRGDIRIEDGRGRTRTIDGETLSRWIVQLSAEPFRKAALLREVGRTVASLERETVSGRQITLDLSKRPLYLRSDLSFGVRAGGSVGHIAGVVNHLGDFAAPPILLTTDDVPTVKAAIESHVIEPRLDFWNFQELPMFVQNGACEQAAERAIAGRPLAFVYQRYSTNNYAGIRIARRYGVPLVLEYNGSEVWVARHWGRRLKYETLTERIEQLNLRAADLVVVVSQPLADQVAQAGVDRARILMNPNGVDPDRYSPDIDGRPVRERCGWRDEIVVGFIGTFGPWHGADVLARAFADLRDADPQLMAPVRLLMIGDGAELPAVRRIIDERHAAEATEFTRLIPQEDGPQYLAACDILVAPHVPNADGTPFFGSPTKLFEYMAMGRAIVASNLDQLGHVIDHGSTGWLVPPGDAAALAAGIRRLVVDPELRTALGAAARRCAVDRYTWREHTKRTIEKLKELVPGV